MSVKLNIGLSRKVGEANYGSRGASINLEVELDNGVLRDPTLLRERVHDLYVLARQSVDDELQRPADSGPEEHAHLHGNGHGRSTVAVSRNGHSNGHGANGNGNGNGHSQGHGRASSNSNANGNGLTQNGRIEVARATQSQIRAIFAITKRQGLDPHTLISDRFRVHKMEELTIREASALIDDLKNGSGVRS